MISLTSSEDYNHLQNLLILGTASIRYRKKYMPLVHQFLSNSQKNKGFVACEGISLYLY